MNVVEVAEALRDRNEHIVLAYGLNSTGKTRLSVAYKDATKDADGNHHGRWLQEFNTVGARAHGSLSVNDDDLLAMPVPRPSGKTSLAEQTKIAGCLSPLESN